MTNLFRYRNFAHNRMDRALVDIVGDNPLCVKVIDLPRWKYSDDCIGVCFNVSRETLKVLAD